MMLLFVYVFGDICVFQTIGIDKQVLCVIRRGGPLGATELAETVMRIEKS
jgi:hypothetical protein